ncbi:MAG: hypothetical protein P8Y36_05595, partial [Alphaproteobacteria bacterium]
ERQQMEQRFINGMRNSDTPATKPTLRPNFGSCHAPFCSVAVFVVLLPFLDSNGIVKANTKKAGGHA